MEETIDEKLNLKKKGSRMSNKRREKLLGSTTSNDRKSERNSLPLAKKRSKVTNNKEKEESK